MDAKKLNMLPPQFIEEEDEPDFYQAVVIVDEDSAPAFIEAVLKLRAEANDISITKLEYLGCKLPE